MGHDLLYSLRLFRESPGLAVIAILSFGLGIGLNLTVFGGFESLFASIQSRHCAVTR